MHIALLGGGQLGRMMIQQALKYDDTLYTLDPDPHCSCAGISQFIQGDFADYDTVVNFGRGKDVLSIEIEHVNVKALYHLEKEGVKVIPRPHIIEIIQQKQLQKDFYRQYDIPTPDYQNVESSVEIDFPLPFVQKMNTGGYDGKGVQLIRTKEDLKNLWDAPSVIERLVDIEREISILVAIGQDGEVSTFPCTEMVADSALNLLDFNICPAYLEPETEVQIAYIVERFSQAAKSSGLFAIELLLDKFGKVWVNETAPRLHNSGHQTQEGNRNSQFEQFFRILRGYPLADTSATGYSGMLNLVGAEGHTGPVFYDGLEKVLNLPNAFVHLYGKQTTKPGRKMGHINVLAPSREELIQQLQYIKGLVTVRSK